MDKTLRLRILFTALGILTQTFIFAQLPTVQTAMPVYTNTTDEAKYVLTDSQDNVYSVYEMRITSPGGAGLDQPFHIGNQMTLPNPPNVSLPGGNSYVSDALLVKQNSTGTVLWAKRTQGKARERIRRIALDNNNNIITVGEFNGAPGHFFGNAHNFPNTPTMHGIIAKLDNNGNLLWEKIFEANDTNYPYGPPSDIAGVKIHSVTTDNSGNIYTQIELDATSVTIDGITFNSPNAVTGSNSVIVAKFSSSGNLIWAKQMTSSSFCVPRLMKLNNLNELIITGQVYDDQYYDGQLISSGSPLIVEGAYIMKIDSSTGSLIWNSRPDGAGFILGFDIDASNNIYAAGTLNNGTFNFGPDVLVNNNSYVTANDALLFKMDNNGTMIWGKNPGPSSGSNLHMRSEFGEDVIVKPDGNIIYTGTIDHPDMDFGNGQIVYHSMYPNWSSTIHGADIALAEYTPAGNCIRAKALGTIVSEGVDKLALKLNGELVMVGSYRNNTLYDGIPLSGGDTASFDAFIATTSPWTTIPVDTTPPTAPLNLTVTGTTTNSVSLSWTAATDNVGVTSYDVFMNGVYYGYVTGTTITVPGLAANTTYSFYVRAKDLFGNVSPNSNTVSATTLFDSQFGTDLYISEYVEGTGDNKALEITNPTANLIDMSMYSFRKQINGSGPWVGNYQLSGFIDTDEAYVITNTNANFNCWFDPDFETLSPMDFDGNDPIGLFKNGVLIDVVGNFNSSAVFGQDVSLWRNVYNPSTTFNTTQWNVFPVDYCDDLLIANPDRYALGVSETAQNKKLKIYPNPVSEKLFFGESVSNANIYSMDGKLILSNISGKEVNVQNLPTGNYIIAGETKDKKTFSAKFIKK